MRVLYAMDLGRGAAAAAVADYDVTIAEGPSHPELAEWAAGVESRLPEIDEMIGRASTNWRLERIAAVERAVLRLATWEMLAKPEIPVRVTINEAIEIARRYGGDESPTFVNGVLDRVARGIDGRSGEIEP